MNEPILVCTTVSCGGSVPNINNPYKEILRLRRLIQLVAKYPLGMPERLWRRVLKEAGHDAELKARRAG